MDLPIWLLVGIVVGISAFVGRMIWYLMRAKDPGRPERHHPDV